MDSSIFTAFFTALYCTFSANRHSAPYLQVLANTTHWHCANIVGYQNTGISALQIKGVGFNGIGQGKININDIKPTAENMEELIGWGAEGEFSMRVYDPDTSLTSYYTWAIVGTDENEAPIYGWCDNESYEPVDDIEFSAGSAFWTETAGDSVEPGITVSGELLAVTASEPRTSVAIDMLKMVSNPMPQCVSTDISNFTPDADNMEELIGWGAEGEFSMRVYDPDTSLTSYYTWAIVGTDENEAPIYGWCDNESYEQVFGIEIPAGGGFWMETAGDSVNPVITFANPLYKAN